MTIHYRCKGCGELDSIVEVSLVPRIMAVIPMDEDGLRYDYDSWDKAFWEAEHNLGFACTNEECEHWQGNYGSQMGGGPIAQFEPAAILPTDIADVIDDNDPLGVGETLTDEHGNEHYAGIKA